MDNYFSHIPSLKLIPNLSPEIVKQIANNLGLTFIVKKDPDGNVCLANSPEVRPEFRETFTIVDLQDYCCAVLHSENFRENHQEFTKIDFSQIPIPTDTIEFWKLVESGKELRQIHSNENNNIVSPFHFENSPPLEGCPKGGVVTSMDKLQAPPPKPNYYTIKNTKIYHHTITQLPYNPKLKPRAKELRYANNLSEVLFWMQVHKSHFYKIDFDRQRIIGNYIVDFYVKKLGLVIEIDGDSHNEKEIYDIKRDNYLKSLGLKIFKIPVVDVLQNMSKAMKDLENFIVENYGVSIENGKKNSLDK